MKKKLIVAAVLATVAAAPAQANGYSGKNSWWWCEATPPSGHSLTSIFMLPCVAVQHIAR
jgi:hypothetical protein